MMIGVPDSQLKDRIKDAKFPASSEEQAFAIGCGCILCGKQVTIYSQNSGILRCGDVITSLYKPYQIPLPKLLLSLRKQPAHHEFAGKITKDFLKLIEYDGEIEIIEQKI